MAAPIKMTFLPQQAHLAKHVGSVAGEINNIAGDYLSSKATKVQYSHERAHHLYQLLHHKSNLGYSGFSDCATTPSLL